MPNTIGCCYKCEKRWVTQTDRCHSTCPDYRKEMHMKHVDNEVRIDLGTKDERVTTRSVNRVKKRR